MPQPGVDSTLVAGPLQNVSVQYKNKDFIADRVFPIIDKCPPTAKIGVYQKGAWFRDEAGIRGPGSRASRGGYPTTFLDVSPKEYAFAKEVTDEDRRAAKFPTSMPLQPDIDAVEFATAKIDIKKEKRVRDLIFNTTWVDANSNGEDVEGLWAHATATSNTFIPDVNKGIAAIYAATAFGRTNYSSAWQRGWSSRNFPTRWEKSSTSRRASSPSSCSPPCSISTRF
jgi:hypothetical protein